MHMVATSAQIDDRPSAFRYPRGEGIGLQLPAARHAARDRQGSYRSRRHQGRVLEPSARASANARRRPTSWRRGLSTTVADARFAKPLDRAMIRRLASEHEVLITVEEGAVGGFGSHVLHYLADIGLLDSGLKIRPMVLPDRFIDQPICPTSNMSRGRPQRPPRSSRLRLNSRLGRQAASACALRMMRWIAKVFVIGGLLLASFARGDPARQRRAARPDSSDHQQLLRTPLSSTKEAKPARI